jgi:hypothetical protein
MKYIMIPYKYSQLEKRIDYEEARKYRDQSYNFHLGQLKLFFSELLFLNLMAKNSNKVLYVGAANGYHIGKLAELFPELKFDLWDPGKFEVNESHNIKIYQQYFTNQIATQYINEGSNILFMCDIRTIAIAKLKKLKKEKEMDELVMNDMNMQKKWIQIIKPIHAYLKFRLPYLVPTFSYLQGPIYLQPYSPRSTETRLMTDNYFDEIEYDCKEFDEKLAYFNYITRWEIKSEKWADLMKKYGIYNCWDNTYALYITKMYLTNIKKIDSEDEIFKLFLDIVNYHYKRYGDKYDVIYTGKPKTGKKQLEESDDE